MTPQEHEAVVRADERLKIAEKVRGMKRLTRDMESYTRDQVIDEVVEVILGAKKNVFEV